MIERYRKTANELLKNSERFQAAEHIEKVAKRAETILSLGNHSGEGWLLTGEMLELIEHGVPNILVCQPFACLPNHVVGKGMIRAVRRKHPEANIVAVDYDPGASEVNQLNRIRLMLARAGGRLAVGSDQIEKAAGPVKCAHGR
jgi:predicted nucleotide-binding protein (sugar kinase/HSP70/actin superfamily)